MERESRPREVTILLGRAAGGDDAALDELARLVYDELQRLASQKLSGERRNHTLGPDDLAHEAWVRLIGSLEERHWADREHFRRAMAEAMRRVLIDHARRRGRSRRPVLDGR